MKQARSQELEILRERVKEYRQLLELSYSIIYRPGPLSPDTFLRFKKKLFSHGIPEDEQRPVWDGDF